MNIRQALLLILVIAIASLGVTPASCEKHDHPTAEHPATEAAEDAEAAAEDVAEEAEAAAEEAEAAVDKAVSEHPTVDRR